MSVGEKMNKDQSGWNAEQRVWIARAQKWFKQFAKDNLPYPHHFSININSEHVELWFDGAKAIGFYPPTEYEQPAFLLSGSLRLSSADDAMALLDLAGKSIKLSAKTRVHALTLEDNQVTDIVTHITGDTPTPEGRSGWRFQSESFPDMTSLMTYVTTEWAEQLQAYR